MNLLGEMDRNDLIKQTDPDMDTLSRNEMLIDSREDLIEVKGEKERQNINISDLETPVTPDTKNRSIKKNQNQGETTYSQVFNLQNNNKLEHQQIKPSDTIDKKTLQNALKPPLQSKEHNSRYNVHQTSNSIGRKRQSNTDLDMQKPSSITVKQRNKTNNQNGKTIEHSARENSIQSNGSGNGSRQRKLIQPQKTQQITTPRGKIAHSLGNGINQDATQSVSPSQKGGYSSPQSKNENRKEKNPVVKMASQQIDVKNPENTYLPQIESRQNSKSPMRQIQKPPMPQKNERIESLNLTKTKFGGNSKQNQKNKQRKEDFKKPVKTQFDTILQKIDMVAGDSSSDIDENMKALQIGKPFKLKKDYQSFCTEYCQYKGQQVPKKYKSIFTSNKYRKVEGGFVLSQRLFLSTECAESEDRRMMPILVVNLDGAMGYWDDHNKFHYVLRPKIIDSLIQLSYDFRLVAVSSKKQKYLFRLIYSLMNINEDQHTKHLYFDSVYQLGSSTEEKNEMCTIKNIEEIQFDLTQVLLDMQFKRQQLKKQQEIIKQDGKNNNNEFVTFWESKLYRPHNKMVIFTTERYLNKNHCYSFDYNYLYQATKFKNEQSKKSPIVIQMPHLRVNPKISFEIIHQLLFALQNITQAVSCENQDRSKIVDGKYYENPEISSFQVCKKLLSFKWNIQEKKMKNNGNVRGLRVFDSNNDPYVNLGNIDFNESYKFIKKYFGNRQSNWLKIKKYYLNTKESKFEKIHKAKLMAKVSFNDSPEIIRMGEENGSQKIAIGTTHDSSKAESNHHRANQYMSDDAKNLYNGLMIRNFKMQQEINAYARHHRILFQHKMAKQKQEEKQIEASLRPIVIFDGEEDENSNVKSGMRQYGKLKSSINHDNKEKIAEQLSLLQQAKKYSFKFRTLQVRVGEFYEQWKTQDCDLSKFTVIDLKIKVTQDSFEKKGCQEINTGRGGEMQMKSNLIEYLSKKQGRIAYTTSQETHLKNNLSQLVDGKQQYVDQQKELQEQDKEQLPSINDKDLNSNIHQNYLDLI